MSGGLRVPGHGRNAPRRSRKRTQQCLVVSGGEVTEKEYFDYLKRTFGFNIRSKSKVKSPSQLVDYAITLKDDRNREPGVDPYSRVWVVVDVDDFHDHRQAERKCRENGIQLVISNPCFEVWLIDHVCVCPDSYVLTKDVERYAKEKDVTTGRNGKSIEFPTINGKLNDALANAERHNADSQRQKARKILTPNDERQFAPWTDMPSLVRTICHQ